MRMKFLTEPAMMIGRSLVVTDIHLGIEHEISKTGVTVPSQKKRIEDRIDSIMKREKADRLIILGDLKHQVPLISWHEYKEVPIFLEHFSKMKVDIVMGNHDGDIRRLAPEWVEVHEPQGFMLGDFLLLHGHAWPSKEDMSAKSIVMGHVHPAVEFFTRRFRSVEPCWLRCEVSNSRLSSKFKTETSFEQGIIMPSFNHIIGGTAFNSKRFEPLGPLLKNNVLKWKTAEVYLLDGTLLGNLNGMKKF